MSDLRIGFIGCGGLARHHMGQVQKYDGAQVSAVCDVDSDAARKAAESHGARAYPNHVAMLETETLEAVYIAIPPFAHGQAELDLCDARLPFFVQKPVALDMATARRIQATVEESGVLTCVGYQLRYTESAACLRSILRDVPVGMGVGRYWCGFTQSGTRGWLTRRSQSGGQMIEQATHLIDMVRYLAGEIVEVYGHEAKMLRGGGDCPDVHCALLKLASGGAVTVTASWGTGDPGDWSQANILQLFWENCRADWTPGSVTIVPNGCGGALPEVEAREIDRVFLDAVQSGDRSKILSPYAEGVRSLAVSAAIDESAASGRPVKLEV